LKISAGCKVEKPGKGILIHHEAPLNLSPSGVNTKSCKTRAIIKILFLCFLIYSRGIL
jgi:hypothetical protein